MLKIADAHAHLTELANLDSCIQKASQVGVFAIVSMGMDFQSNIQTLQISEDYKDNSVKILPSLGLHPWNLEKRDITPTINHIQANRDKAAGIGEVGLDYWLKDVRRDPIKKEVQHQAFRKAINMAKQYDKPITVHSRGAWQDCFDMIVESEVKNVIFHWFSGPSQLVKEIVDHGFNVSATPAVEYSKEHRAVILNTPLENLLIETDSPVKYGDMISEPKDVRIPLRMVASLKGVKLEEVAEKTTQNFSRIYKNALSCYNSDPIL